MTFYDVSYRRWRQIWHLLDTLGRRLSLSLSDWGHTVFPACLKKKSSTLCSCSSAVLLTVFVCACVACLFIIDFSQYSVFSWHIASIAQRHTWGGPAFNLVAIFQKWYKPAAPGVWTMFFLVYIIYTAEYSEKALVVWSLRLASDRWGPVIPQESWERPVCLLCTFSGVSVALWFIPCCFSTIGLLFGACLGPYTITHFILKYSMHFYAQKKIGSRSDSQLDPEMGAKSKRVKLEKKSDILFRE